MKACAIDGCCNPLYAQGHCKQHYYQIPEVRERRREYQKRYNQQPKMKEYLHQYYQQPEVRARLAERRKRPDVIEKQRAYMKAYNHRPEVIAKRRGYTDGDEQPFLLRRRRYTFPINIREASFRLPYAILLSARNR
jgi:hypothetical protein